MNDLVCEHGSFRRKCEICERDERIAELERRLDEARKALLWYARPRLGDEPLETVIDAVDTATRAAKKGNENG